MLPVAAAARSTTATTRMAATAATGAAAIARCAATAATAAIIPWRLVARAGAVVSRRLVARTWAIVPGRLVTRTRVVVTLLHDWRADAYRLASTAALITPAVREIPWARIAIRTAAIGPRILEPLPAWIHGPIGDRLRLRRRATGSVNRLSKAAPVMISLSAAGLLNRWIDTAHVIVGSEVAAIRAGLAATGTLPSAIHPAVSTDTR